MFDELKFADWSLTFYSQVQPMTIITGVTIRASNESLRRFHNHGEGPSSTMMLNKHLNTVSRHEDAYAKVITDERL